MIYLLLFYVLFSFTDLRIFIVMTYTIMTIGLCIVSHYPVGMGRGMERAAEADGM